VIAPVKTLVSLHVINWSVILMALHGILCNAEIAVLFIYFGLLVIWLDASFSSRTPGLDLGTVHVQHVVNEVPPRQAFLPVLRYFLVSTVRRYSVITFIWVFFPSTGLRSRRIFKQGAVSDVGDHLIITCLHIFSLRKIKMQMWVCAYTYHQEVPFLIRVLTGKLWQRLH
jgi:hypothetical protein